MRLRIFLTKADGTFSYDASSVVCLQEGLLKQEELSFTSRGLKLLLAFKEPRRLSFREWHLLAPAFLAALHGLSAQSPRRRER